MQLRWILGFAIALSTIAGVTKAQQPQRSGPADTAAPSGGADSTAPKTGKERSSYAVGIDIGRGLKAQGLEVDANSLVRGLTDALGGSKPMLSDKELAAAMADLQKTATARAQEMMTRLAERNKKDGDAFLADNKKKEGVKTLPSGLQYKVVKEGNGATPRKTDIVTTHYRGTFLDGTEFDSSYRRNEPAKFPVNRVIKGWTEALQLMKVGDKWQLFIPSDLAYGEQGMGQDIPPNATLIFDIELLDVKPAAANGETLPGQNQ
ncbi:MAG TPA: FKBP-type peptidyl-prolyl cis-trans isomerase [Pirellulales bacterium]|jgi:FKBP-type peptidyl-prolyl cis-trans isomerase FklB|nr:FKBP-type peptidyl-prolyl cis-trans isomerase [Pirellulales bacterium]